VDADEVVVDDDVGDGEEFDVGGDGDGAGASSAAVEASASTSPTLCGVCMVSSARWV
jgi:hypothetical protein